MTEKRITSFLRPSFIFLLIFDERVGEFEARPACAVSVPRLAKRSRRLFGTTAGPNSWMRIVVGKHIKIRRIFIKRARARAPVNGRTAARVRRTKDGNPAPRLFLRPGRLTLHLGSAYLVQSNSRGRRRRIRLLSNQPAPLSLLSCYAPYCASTFMGQRDRVKRGSLGFNLWAPRTDRRIVARASMHLHGNLEAAPLSLSLSLSFSLWSITFRALWRFVVHPDLS